MNKWDYLLIVFIILVVFLIVFVATKSKQESFKCSIDPIGFGVKQLEKASGLDITCYCYGADKPTNFMVFD